MRLNLKILAQSFAITRLAPDAPLPDWATGGDVWSVTRTPDELSIVSETGAGAAVQQERDWRCFQVQGPLPFTLTGVLAALSQPLADAGIGIFVISTFDTDYLFVKAADLPRATEELVGAGHEVVA